MYNFIFQAVNYSSMAVYVFTYCSFVGSVLNVDDIAEKISETFKVRLKSTFLKLY